jgi:hypothetical protein
VRASATRPLAHLAYAPVDVGPVVRKRFGRRWVGSHGPFRLALVSYAYDRSEVEEARLGRGKSLAPGGPVPRI